MKKPMLLLGLALLLAASKAQADLQSRPEAVECEAPDQDTTVNVQVDVVAGRSPQSNVTIHLSSDFGRSTTHKSLTQRTELPSLDPLVEWRWDTLDEKYLVVVNTRDGLRGTGFLHVYSKWGRKVIIASIPLICSFQYP